MTTKFISQYPERKENETIAERDARIILAEARGYGISSISHSEDLTTQEVLEIFHAHGF